MVSGDGRAMLLELIAPLAVGDQVLPGLRFDGASAELGLRYRFLVDGAVLWVEIAPLGRMARRAAQTSQIALAYRNEGGRSRVPDEVGVALCRALASVIAKNEQGVLGDRRGEPRADEARIARVEVESLLELHGPDGETFYSLSPYVGCLIGCRFCYAQPKVSVVRELARRPEVPWGSYVDVRVNAHQVLARELEILPVHPIKLCPVVSDPYQAIEAKERVTRRCLEAIAGSKRDWATLILTRSRLVVEDAERIAAIARSYVGVSIPTIDDEVRRHFEPRAASIGERLEALASLRRAGVRTFAVVQPILHGDIEALADGLAERVSSASIDVLRGTVGAADDFADPRYAPTADERWQRERALELAEALRCRGVAVWSGELPPELSDR